MLINKYNSAKGNNLTRAVISTGAISGGTSSSGGVSSIDRVLWGQNDEGEDIDGSMWVNGSLYLGAIDYGSEDDEDTTDGSEIYVDDAEIGSIIASGLVQGKDMYCKEHPYITYPIVGGKKTDLRELFNGFDERIKANATNIKTNTTNIATNKTNISTNATNIAANTAEITKLKSRVTTNETNIKTNTTNISTNATNIKNLDKRVTTNTTNISTNTTNITGLDTRVTALETNVTDLSASVDTNTTDITTLKTDVSTNTTDITNLKTDVSTNATNIATNKTNISTNATDIKNIDTRVTKLENKVADKSDYEYLKTKVDTNTTNISTNTNDITTIKNEIKNLQDSMPVGSIIMFNGKAEEIPSGWAICNGENGTPNLIDRFILGSTYCGGMGGKSQVTLSVSQLPPHKHRVAKCWYGKSDNAADRQVVRWDDSFDTNEQVWTGETGLGLPIDIMPPYFRLIYIMKVGTTTDTTQTT